MSTCLLATEFARRARLHAGRPCRRLLRRAHAVSPAAPRRRTSSPRRWMERRHRRPRPRDLIDHPPLEALQLPPRASARRRSPAGSWRKSTSCGGACAQRAPGRLRGCVPEVTRRCSCPQAISSTSSTASQHYDITAPTAGHGDGSPGPRRVPHQAVGSTAMILDAVGRSTTGAKNISPLVGTPRSTRAITAVLPRRARQFLRLSSQDNLSASHRGRRGAAAAHLPGAEPPSKRARSIQRRRRPRGGHRSTATRAASPGSLALRPRSRCGLCGPVHQPASCTTSAASPCRPASRWAPGRCAPRSGTRPPAPVPHRPHPRPLRRPRAARPDREPAPRAHRRLALPAGVRGAELDAATCLLAAADVSTRSARRGRTGRRGSRPVRARPRGLPLSTTPCRPVLDAAGTPPRPARRCRRPTPTRLPVLRRLILTWEARSRGRGSSVKHINQSTPTRSTSTRSAASRPGQRFAMFAIRHGLASRID